MWQSCARVPSRALYLMPTRPSRNCVLTQRNRAPASSARARAPRPPPPCPVMCNHDYSNVSLLQQAGRKDRLISAFTPTVAASESNSARFGLFRLKAEARKDRFRRQIGPIPIRARTHVHVYELSVADEITGGNRRRMSVRERDRYASRGKVERDLSVTARRR